MGWAASTSRCSGASVSGWRRSTSPRRALIYDTLPAKIIAGARGRNPLAVDAIAATLVALGRLMGEQPQIDEVDLNPCLALDDVCLAVDARIILAKAD